MKKESQENGKSDEEGDESSQDDNGKTIEYEQKLIIWVCFLLGSSSVHKTKHHDVHHHHKNGTFTNNRSRKSQQLTS